MVERKFDYTSDTAQTNEGYIKALENSQDLLNVPIEYYIKEQRNSWWSGDVQTYTKKRIDTYPDILESIATSDPNRFTYYIMDLPLGGYPRWG